MTDVTVLSTATIEFMSDGSMVASLSSIDGITARRLETISTLLYNKLSELRAVERRKESIRIAAEARRQPDIDEQPTVDEEKASG